MSYPNEHITGMLDCIQKMQSFVPYVTDETEKQQFIAILSAMQGYAISASNELAINEYRINQLYQEKNESRIHIQEKSRGCLPNQHLVLLHRKIYRRHHREEPA